LTKRTLLLLLTILVASAHSVRAQATGWSNPLAPPPAAQPAQTQTFKVGDHVEIQSFSQWLPGTVKELVYYNIGPCGAPSPTCSRVGAYIVTCTVIATNGPEEVTVALTDIRARAATAADKSSEAETAAALARQPKGNSIGAKYGTREPRTCGDRTAPAQGAPSAAQATQYVICELEQGNGRDPLLLATNVKILQVASVSHPPNLLTKEITTGNIAVGEPIWDIRGSFTSYRCSALSTLIASNDFARTHNCWVSEQPAATGYCWKNTLGQWRCGMLGGVVNWKPNVLPPAGY
jgi:hypothetical protein